VAGTAASFGSIAAARLAETQKKSAMALVAFRCRDCTWLTSSAKLAPLSRLHSALAVCFDDVVASDSKRTYAKWGHLSCPPSSSLPEASFPSDTQCHAGDPQVWHLTHQNKPV
jgi:hypothetical protein